MQAFRREPRNQEIFDDVNDQYRRANLVAFRLVAWFMPGIRLIGNVTIAVVLLYGGYLAYHGEVTVGVLAAFLLYLRQFFEPMKEISQFYNTFQSASAALEKLSGVLEEEPDVPEPSDPRAARRRRAASCASTTSGSPTSTARPCCPTSTSRCPPGRRSRSSARPARARRRSPSWRRGSTTRPAGAVLLDGVDLRRLDLRRPAPRGRDGDAGELPVQRHRRRQHPVRPAGRHRRARSRRRPGRSARTSSSPRCRRATTPTVSNRGGRLCAGQRQLVAFARAFLADPAVLILDEATSSLDIPSERLVQQALGTILAGRTAVIIAHRLSTVEIADRVLVLEHGRIVEDGAPERARRRRGRPLLRPAPRLGRLAGLTRHPAIERAVRRPSTSKEQFVGRDELLLSIGRSAAGGGEAERAAGETAGA